MKKLSLNSIKEALSRDEMRVISGGSGSGATCYCGNGRKKVFSSSAICQSFCSAECRPHAYGCG